MQLTETVFLFLTLLATLKVCKFQNIALNKPTNQSTYQTEGLDKNAVDGKPQTYSCTHTKFENLPDQWWYVNLEDTYIIGNIKITNRADCCPKELSDFIVEVGVPCSFSGSICWSLCFYYPGVQDRETIEIQCSENNIGQYVKIQLKQPSILSLCEVEVYASLVETSDIASSSTLAATESSVHEFSYIDSEVTLTSVNFETSIRQAVTGTLTDDISWQTESEHFSGLSTEFTVDLTNYSPYGVPSVESYNVTEITVQESDTSGIQSVSFSVLESVEHLLVTSLPLSVNSESQLDFLTAEVSEGVSVDPVIASLPFTTNDVRPSESYNVGDPHTFQPSSFSIATETPLIISALFSVNSNSQLDSSEGHTVVISESVSDLLSVSPPCTTVNSEDQSDTSWGQSTEKSNGFSEDLLLVSSFISVNSESQSDALKITAIDESSQGIAKTSDRIWTSTDFNEPGSVVSTTVDSSSQIVKMVDVPGTIIVSNITCATSSYLPITAKAEDMCYCDCFEIDLNPAALQEKLDNILSNLTVNTDQLSSTRREKTSAVDDRPTAISVGFFGILIITVVIAAVVFQDVISLLFFLATGVIRKIKTGQFTDPRKPPKKKKRKTETESPTKKETINPTSYTSLPDVENPEIVESTVEQIPMVSKAAALTGRPNIPPSSKPKMAKPKNKPKVKRPSDCSLPSKGKAATKISGVTRPIKKKTGTKKLVNVKAIKSNPT